MENKVICSKPFNTIHNRPGRKYTPCCWFIPPNENSPNSMLPIDYFDSEDSRRLRKEMMEGEMTDFIYSQCRFCFDRERDVGYSPRTQLKKMDDNLLSNFNDDGSLVKGSKNRFINIAINVFGYSCNLECYTCDPMASTTRMKRVDDIQEKLDAIGITRDKISESHKHNNLNVDQKNKNQFDKIINQLMEYAENITSIEIVGGEPMLMKSHFQLLNRLIETGHSKYIRLLYNSNMTLMELDEMKYYFDNFNSTQIQWSVDALKERNHWIRYPTDWDTTTKNVFDIQKYLNENKKGYVIATITPSLLGIVSLRKTYNWLVVRKLISKQPLIINSVSKPRFLRTRNLPDLLKQEISNDVRIVSEYHYNDMMQPRDQHHFELAIKYFDLLDQSRGTDWRLTFPEVSKYVN